MSVLMSESFIHSFKRLIHSETSQLTVLMNRPLNHWLTRFIRLLIIEILLYCFLSIAVSIYTFLWVTLCVLSLSHTHSHSHLAQHKYFISCCLHWMPLKLESFSRETMYLHVTVSVRMAVTSLPAPLTIKRSAQNWQDVRLTGQSPIRAGHVKNHPMPVNRCISIVFICNF